MRSGRAFLLLTLVATLPHAGFVQAKTYASGRGATDRDSHPNHGSFGIAARPYSGGQSTDGGDSGFGPQVVL